MNYPNGQVEHAFGLMEWQINSETNISVSTAVATIYNIIYRGNVQVNKVDGEWQALFGDVYMTRVHESEIATTSARHAFKKLAVEIAVEIAGHKGHLEALKIAELRDTMNTSASEIIRLKEEIDELEEIILNSKAQLRIMGETP